LEVKNDGLIETTRKLGSSIGGMIGERSFEELELAFVTKLFPKKFANMSTLRTRQHILLYWRRGFLKTTLLQEFSKTIPSKFKIVRLSSATTEILCGSINIPKSPFQQARIVPPVLAGADFVLMLEHSAVLKHGGPMVAKVSILNDIYEGDRISTSLVKLGQTQIDPAQRSELEKLGVTYNPSEATISYEPDILMLSASHPFDAKTLSILVDSGHLDRFRIIQCKITPEMARNTFGGDFCVDKTLQEQLRNQNEELCKTEIKSIDAPIHAMLKPIYDQLFAITEIPDFRIKGDIIRTVAAHMVMRHFDQRNLKEVYTDQDYTVEDIQFICERINDFVQPRISPLVSEGYSGTTRKRDETKELACTFLKTSYGQGTAGEPLRAIIAYVQNRMSNVHYQTIINALQELLREHKLEKVPDMHGYYRLVEKKERS